MVEVFDGVFFFFLGDGVCLSSRNPIFLAHWFYAIPCWIIRACWCCWWNFVGGSIIHLVTNIVFGCVDFFLSSSTSNAITIATTQNSADFVLIADIPFQPLSRPHRGQLYSLNNHAFSISTEEFFLATSRVAGANHHPDHLGFQFSSKYGQS